MKGTTRIDYRQRVLKEQELAEMEKSENAPYTEYAEAKLRERQGNSLGLKEITDIVQEDLNRRLVGEDSPLRDNYNYWKAHFDDKNLYDATSKEQVAAEITKLFEKIKNSKDSNENISYQSHLTAIGFLEADLK